MGKRVYPCRIKIAKILAVDPEAKCIVSSGYASDPTMTEPGKYGFKAASAWRFHADRLRKQGKHVFGSHNTMLLLLGAEAALVLAVLFYSGPRGALFFLVQALVAISFLDIVNYFEHYGMMEHRLSNRS